MWTRFMDMHSGGGTKVKPYDKILIEAPEAEARVIFANRFDRDPDCVTCTCCGADYSVSEEESLEGITAYDRGCAYEEGQWVEGPDKWNRYKPLAEYLNSPDVLVIRADEIKPEERIGEVRRRGYVWVD